MERHETEKLQKLTLQNIWINTDQLQYYLNNTKKKGFGSVGLDEDDPLLQTHVIASAEANSRYVFRADVAYDWEYTPTDLEWQTFESKEDHLPLYAIKNARLKFPYAPVSPSVYDDQTSEDYQAEKAIYDEYKSILNGIHTDQTYTAIAHYWLLRRMLKVKEWNIVTDNDGALRVAFYKAFAKEILDGYANHFLYKVDKKSNDKTAAEYMGYEDYLRSWGRTPAYLYPKKALKNSPIFGLLRNSKETPFTTLKT